MRHSCREMILRNSQRHDILATPSTANKAQTEIDALLPETLQSHQRRLHKSLAMEFFRHQKCYRCQFYDVHSHKGAKEVAGEICKEFRIEMHDRSLPWRG